MLSCVLLSEKFVCSSVFTASSTPNETPRWQLQLTDYRLTSEIKLVLKRDLAAQGGQQSGLSADGTPEAPLSA